jgi:hypothetical protein
MLDILRVLLGIFFIPATVYFGIKGLVFRLSDRLDKESYKMRAIYHTVTIFCGLISFEVFYPTIDALICPPVLLILVWTNYFVAVAQINYFKK